MSQILYYLWKWKAILLNSSSAQSWSHFSVLFSRSAHLSLQIFYFYRFLSSLIFSSLAKPSSFCPEKAPNVSHFVLLVSLESLQFHFWISPILHTFSHFFLLVLLTTHFSLSFTSLFPFMFHIRNSCNATIELNSIGLSIRKINTKPIRCTNFYVKI